MSAAANQKEFGRLAKELLKLPDVTLGHGKGGFGEGALNVHGKIFAMLTSKNQFAVKLAKSRVTELVKARKGEQLAMGSRLMKEWLVVPEKNRDSWQSVAKEAHAFVAGIT